MYKSMLLRPLPILLAGAALVACSEGPRSGGSEANLAAAAAPGSGWQGVVEAPPMAEAVATGSGWQGVVEAPPMAEAVATATNTPARPLGGCTLTPSANAAGFDVTALLMTVRATDGVIEMLHDARCTDGRIGTVWVTANVI